jgi:hypothetical protein
VNRSLCSRIGIAAAVWTLLVSLVARAETFNLELKRLDDRSQYSGPLPDQVFRQVNPQHFWSDSQTPQDRPGQASFSSLVKKEPGRYECNKPFRFVARFGSDDFAGVLDATQFDTEGYDLLYFDRNHNGDLTDDGVIKAMPLPRNVRFGQGSMNREFPCVGVALAVDGTKFDYAFRLSVWTHKRNSHFSTQVSVGAAAYREGEITAGGKRHRIVVLDFSSDGRFDDGYDDRSITKTDDGRIWAKAGDKLIVDPETGLANPFWLDASGTRGGQLVSKLVNLDGRFYELKITPAGDSITLTPSSLPLGTVTAGMDGFQAMFYGEQGFVKVVAGPAKQAPIPAGKWKLYNYLIDATPATQPSTNPKAARVFRYTLVQAAATNDCLAFDVREGQASVLPFGPPYKPVVALGHPRSRGEAQLEMKLVGSGGELCSSLYVNGNQPKAPAFTILGPSNKVIKVGSFEFG